MCLRALVETAVALLCNMLDIRIQSNRLLLLLDQISPLVTLHTTHLPQLDYLTLQTLPAQILDTSCTNPMRSLELLNSQPCMLGKSTSQSSQSLLLISLHLDSVRQSLAVTVEDER
jgi:hypothetical protein